MQLYLYAGAHPSNIIYYIELMEIMHGFTETVFAE